MFDRYWKSAKDDFNVESLDHKSACIALCENSDRRPDLPRLVGKLFDDFPKQSTPSRSKANWQWRDTIEPAKEENQEVWVERKACEISRHGNSWDWTCQMPVASGKGGSHKNRRRSIDLVRHLGDNKSFEFVELKWLPGDKGRWGANNPLYAAFEILGYGLAYLAAREGNCLPAKALRRDLPYVLGARRIDLRVLAPVGYYKYKRSGALERFPNRLMVS